MDSGPAYARQRYFDKCPELPALFVVVMKNQRISNYVNKHRKHDPSPSDAPGDTGENLPGVLGFGRDDKVASAEWIYWQGSSPGRESRRHLPDVVHQFHHRQEPLLRWNLSRIEAPRTHPLHGQIRRPGSARRNADHNHVESGVLWHGIEHHAGRSARRHSRRGVLSRLAGIADAAGETRRG